MPPFLNFHAHRKATSPEETAICNLMLPTAPGTEDAPDGPEFFSAGIHPWHIPENPEAAFRTLEGLAGRPECVAVGETGLDKLAGTAMERQTEVCIRQMRIAMAFRRPVVFHCVRAWGELDALCKAVRPDVPCVIHGFRGKPELADSLLRKGFYLSFGFRHNPQSLTVCPPHRLLLESDEDPRPIGELYRTAARLRSCTVAGLNTQCWENLHRLARLR